MALLHYRRIERRRTGRATMCINVLVYGEHVSGEKFRYWTRSIAVSGHGGVVLLETTEDSNAARFSVTDSGPGIAPEQVPRVFEPYWQAREHRHQGSGLGLWIVKVIVERHGGCIAVESEVGRGSTFYFTLPMGCRQAPAEP